MRTEVKVYPHPDSAFTGINEGEKRTLDLPNDESTPIVIDGYVFSDWRWCGISGGTAVILHDENPERIQRQDNVRC